MRWPNDSMRVVAHRNNTHIFVVSQMEKERNRENSIIFLCIFEHNVNNISLNKHLLVDVSCVVFRVFAGIDDWPRPFQVI